jgi:hypothetical protein
MCAFLCQALGGSRRQGSIGNCRGGALITEVPQKWTSPRSQWPYPDVHASHTPPTRDGAKYRCCVQIREPANGPIYHAGSRLLLLIGGMAVAYSNRTKANRIEKPVTDVHDATANARAFYVRLIGAVGFDPPTASVLGHLDQFGSFVPSGPARPPRRAAKASEVNSGARRHGCERLTLAPATC